MHYKHMSTTVYYKLDFVHETANKLCYHAQLFFEKVHLTSV